MKLYRTIVADPPWRYTGKGPVGSRAPGGYNLDGTLTVQVAVPYPTMTLDELALLQIPAAKDAHLYLWFTNAFGAEAHALAKHWGFEPKTIITWAKVKKDKFEPSMKTGYYFRGATEHILFCVRGSLLTTQNPPRPTVVFHPREPHSVKPQVFFDLAAEQSPGPYLEMFARRKRPGWDAWGNEVESDVVIRSRAA